jgi:LysR family glycine cleavage system transcriptional activator
LTTKIDLRKLPPLNALKGFEATTRRQSVRDAADELCVTHPAVSHQIQLLENDLGVQLFSREGRTIVPTPEGRQFYGHVRKALEALIEGAESLRRSRAEQPLRIQTYVTASIRWLASRIPAFQEQHPDIRLQLSTCALEWDFDESLGDVGLVYRETPPGPDFEWVPLFDYALYPVCSPQMRRRLPERPQPRDLLGLPLVEVYTETRNWDIWFQAAGVDYVPGSRVVVDTLAIALQMALDGAGVALANGPFAEDDLRSGRLLVPMDLKVPCPGEWGLICRREVLEKPKVQAFIAWFGRTAGGPAVR